MIEPIMFVGIGFLVAGLLVIGVIPLVHARAVRLTMRRIEALTPLSMAEIQADKDQLRAEFAMSTRRLEMSVEQLKAKTTNQLTEIGKKSEAIGRLKLELGEKTAQLMALEAKEKQLAEDVLHSQSDLTARIKTLNETERALAETEAEARRDHRAIQRTRDQRRQPSHRPRHAARADRGAQGPGRKLREGDPRPAGAPQPQDRGGRERDPAARRGAGARRTALDPRRRSRPPAHRADDGGRNPRPARAGAERAARRAGPLPGRPRIRQRPPAQRGDERAEDRGRRCAPSWPRPTTGIGSRPKACAPRRRRSKTQLRQSEEERAKLQRDICGHEARRRERLGQRAHGKRGAARAHQRRGGRGRPADRGAGRTGLADRHDHRRGAAGSAAANGAGDKAVPSIAPNGGESKGTLADRIRALQSRASARVPQAS